MPSTVEKPNLYPETWMFSGSGHTEARCLEQIGRYQEKYGNQCRLLIGPVPPNHDKPTWTFSVWVDYPEPRDVARSLGLPFWQWPKRERSYSSDYTSRVLEDRL